MRCWRQGAAHDQDEYKQLKPGHFVLLQDTNYGNLLFEVLSHPIERTFEEPPCVGVYVNVKDVQTGEEREIGGTSAYAPELILLPLDYRRKPGT